jgi:cell division septation protein DedD
LQAKYPNVLGGREPIIRRADLGAKGIYFRAMVGPFTSADQASELCSSLKAAGGSCIVQKN